MIAWPCVVCHQPIENDDGYLCADPHEAQAVLEARAEWSDGHGPELDIAGLMTLPRLAPWLAFHAECDQRECRGGPYSIEVRRLRTPLDLLWWTAHLLAKRWVAGTAWLHIIEEAADRAGAREP